MTSTGSSQGSAPQGILSLPPDVLEKVVASPQLTLRDRTAVTSCCRALLAWAAAAPPAVWGDLHLRLRARKIPSRRRGLAGPGLRTWAARLLGLASPRAPAPASQLPAPHPLAAWLARRRTGLRKVQLHFGGPPTEAAEVLRSLGVAPHLTSLSLSGPAFGSSSSSSNSSAPSGAAGSGSSEGSSPSDAGAALLSMLAPAASLASFKLTECSLQHIPPPLEGLPALRALYLPYNTRLGQSGPQALDTLLALTSLTLLELKGCGLTGVPTQLTALSGLRDLDLSHSRLDGGQAALRPLATLRCLSRLNLSWCSLLRCPEQLSGMTNLADLALSYQSLGLGGPEAFEALPLGLTHLELEHCGLRALPQQLRALAPSLRALDVSRNPLFPRGDDAGGAGDRAASGAGEDGDNDGNLSLLGELSMLISLSIFDCGLRGVPSDLSPTLQSLLIGVNPGITAWAPLARLQGLTRLHIGSCMLSGLPLELAALPRLLCLCASWNNFEGSGGNGGGEGDPAFEPLRQLGQLTELALCQCKLKGVPQEVTALQSLVELDVRSNAGDQPGRGWGAGTLTPLLSVPGLARLRAGGNQLHAVEGELAPRLQALLREEQEMLEQDLDW